MTTPVHGDTSAPARPQLWRITDRASFQALRQNGRRARRDGISVTWLAPSPGAEVPPRVAFSIGRGVGGAVARNRLRRRLRAGLRELRVGGRLPAGAYLVGASAELIRAPWATLLATLDEAVAAATGQGAR